MCSTVCVIHWQLRHTKGFRQMTIKVLTAFNRRLLKVNKCLAEHLADAVKHQGSLPQVNNTLPDFQRSCQASTQQTPPTPPPPQPLQVHKQLQGDVPQCAKSWPRITVTLINIIALEAALLQLRLCS